MHPGIQRSSGTTNNQKPMYSSRLAAKSSMLACRDHDQHHSYCTAELIATAAARVPDHK